jgi:hypothetical protein
MKHIGTRMRYLAATKLGADSGQDDVAVLFFNDHADATCTYTLG